MDRFIVERSRLQPNSWVLTDRENKIVVVFEDGKFNETQRVSPLEDTTSDSLSAGVIAQVMREIGEWARRYHSSKCFSQPFGFEYDENERLCLYRRKCPKWRLHIEGDANSQELASSLRKASEFLRKGWYDGQ
nr:MAG TPA: hypothetical protein [Caudoviricetes sp.]